MRPNRYLFIAFFLAFILSKLFIINVKAQEQDSTLQKVKVKAYVPIVLGDSVYKFTHDTTLFLPPELINQDSSAVLQSEQFYNKLHQLLGKNRLTKELSNLLLVKQYQNSDSLSEAPEILSTGMCFEGKIVRSITYVRLPPFGADVKKPDPIITTRVTRTANGLHAKTRERVIDKNIVFNVGDVINDDDFYDSERLLRALQFIKDALIYACEVDDSNIDVYIITQDQWTIGVRGNYQNINNFELGLYNNNFLGTGQYAYIGAVVKNDEPEPFGYNFEYRFQNINGSFIDLDIVSYDNYLESTWGVSAYKDFITSNTKTAGGFEARNLNKLYGYTISDSAFIPIDSTERFWEPLEYTFLSGWVGRSFHINQSRNENITFSMGVDNIQFFKRPHEVDTDTLYQFHNRTQYAFSATINQRNYRKLSYLQGFGRTEDVPHGWLISVTSGWESNEFLGRRPYIGMAMDIGQFTPYGFFKLRGEVGSFLTDQYRQETFHLNFNYFTNLIAVRDNFFRLLLDIDLMDGNDRIPGDYLYFIDNDVFSDFQINRFSKKGVRRLQIKQENIWFTPLFFYGFKFAVYQSFEVGFLSDPDRVSISNDDVFSSFGAGIRTRNENLVFNTLTLDLKYYPNANFNNSAFQVLLTTVIDLPLRDFKPTKPSFIKFE
ncbi:hypothetical protein [Flammeovirga aprica]|uniref:Haemolysin activator HlyB C-terminal domain-containing protein n=1 Tax=Flammeovirga aprica JL-4 TaxID=694437 RepID=A0A7X9XAV3_9BACT|nr:hypothetical protein [Flammeovirga aprica]NME69988.1 hypothetical protein [Flammeovirga aprica JL-4]